MKRPNGKKRGYPMTPKLAKIYVVLSGVIFVVLPGSFAYGLETTPKK